MTRVSKTRKATFNVREDVLARLDEVVAQGGARSKNALVERALLREFEELRRQGRTRAWLEARADPLFMRDVAEVDQAFALADEETARGIA